MQWTWTSRRQKETRTASGRMMNKGWSSAGLKTVGDDPELWTAADAARLLGPPLLTEPQVRQLIRLAGLEPQGKRRVTRSGTSGGRHARVYPATDLIRAFDAIEGVLR
jgi:hypothetical protein